MNYLENCASCWSHWRMCITVHGSENVKKNTVVTTAGWYVSRCYCGHALHFDVPASYIFISSVFFILFSFCNFLSALFSLSPFSSHYSQILILSSFLLWFFQTVGGSIKFAIFVLAAGGSLGTKINCPVPATWEIVNALKPAAFRCYCTCSITVREVAYTNGAVTHVQSLSCLALCPVTKWLFCGTTALFQGHLVAVDDADDLLFWVSAV